MNNIGRAVSLNDRQQAYDDIERVKAMLGDLQTMLNREETTYK